MYPAMAFHKDGLLDTKERAITMVRRRAYTNYDWLRGDLNLQAKSLMSLRSIPAPKENPGNLLRLPGFFTNLVAGTRNHLKIAIRSSGLSSHLMPVTDGIQLGSVRIFTTFSIAVPAFRGFLGY
jgi:hypothetical protein